MEFLTLSLRHRQACVLAIQDRQVAENEDEIDDVVEQDDPYDDNLPQAEWEELFNGIHADDI